MRGPACMEMPNTGPRPRSASAESPDRPDRAAHGSRIPRRWLPSACSTRRSCGVAGPADRARAPHRTSSPRGPSRRRAARWRSEAEVWRHQTRSAVARTRRETAPTVARCAPHRRPGAASPRWSGTPGPSRRRHRRAAGVPRLAEHRPPATTADARRPAVPPRCACRSRGDRGNTGSRRTPRTSGRPFE